LQIADHVALTLKSPMWCAMKLARGEKIVRSLPRSFISRSWLAFDRFPQLIVGNLQVRRLGIDAGSLIRQSACCAIPPAPLVRSCSGRGNR
jgi:hypothetical protein